MSNFIQSFAHDRSTASSSDEPFLKDFLVILRLRNLYNYLYSSTLYRVVLTFTPRSESLSDSSSLYANHRSVAQPLEF